MNNGDEEGEEGNKKKLQLPKQTGKKGLHEMGKAEGPARLVITCSDSKMHYIHLGSKLQCHPEIMFLQTVANS